MQQKFPSGVQVFIMPPSLKILENRLRTRGSDSDSIIKYRLENARKEMEAFRDYEYVIINENLEESLLYPRRIKMTCFSRNSFTFVLITPINTRKDIIQAKLCELDYKLSLVYKQHKSSLSPAM